MSMTIEEDLAVASAIMAGVKELVELHNAAKSGTVAPQDAITAAKLFTDRIAANRVAAQTALDAKFKTP